MSELLSEAAFEAHAQELFAAVSALVEQGRAVASVHANAALTMTHWQVGRIVGEDILDRERAPYGKRIVATLSRQLVGRYGRGFDEKTLRRMVQFFHEFPQERIVATLSRQLTWSHIVEILPVKDAEARAFYVQQSALHNLGVRDLRGIVARKAFERREIADAQVVDGSAVPLDAFRDPFLLDFLGLKGSYQERDLESAIIREMEAFLLEAGRGWAFVDRQKRISVDTEDYYLDLLFFSRPLRRLVAVELKIGKFKAVYEGQMKLYLKWLDRYERQEGEETPIGLILCTEASREQIELLEMHKDGIVVAEYWTELPPKRELEERIQIILRDAKERLARRELAAVPDGERGASNSSETDESDA
ncbi:MAG: PDDEXK nuclease domain-containing protein [Propionibacteriaceae bacterium]|jgi:predicted nuclease of restriction endonuclease-like (RecB) superfamily|nr:PDDEXK nuclease domain-containing protein [Propionibacteriaceae bacterium]